MIALCCGLTGWRMRGSTPHAIVRKGRVSHLFRWPDGLWRSALRGKGRSLPIPRLFERQGKLSRTFIVLRLKKVSSQRVAAICSLLDGMYCSQKTGMKPGRVQSILLSSDGCAARRGGSPSACHGLR